MADIANILAEIKELASGGDMNWKTCKKIIDLVRQAQMEYTKAQGQAETANKMIDGMLGKLGSLEKTATK